MIPVIKRTILFLCLGLNAFGQDPMDSLKIALRDAKHDTTRCAILSAMIEAESDERIWPAYNKKLLLLSENGIKNSAPGKLKNTYRKYLSQVYNNNGYTASVQGDLNTAIQFYEKSLKISEEIGDKTGIAASANNLGFTYNHQGDIYKAIESYHKSLKICEEIGYKQGIATALNNIGMIYDVQGDLDKGIECFNRSYKVYEEINDIDGMSYALNNLGAAYDSEERFEDALRNYDKALKLSESSGDKRGVAATLNNIGLIYLKKNDATKALGYFREGLELHKDVNERSGISYSECNIAHALYKLGNMSEALIHGKRSMDMAKELGYPDNILRIANAMKNIYRMQNNYKEAFAMAKLEIQMRDSINNEKTKKAAVKKQFQYMYEKQAAADSVKHAELQKIKMAEIEARESQLRQDKTQRYALYSGLGLIVVFAVFIFNRLNVARKQKAIIELQKQKVDEAYARLHEKNKEVLDSINYARRIQISLLPTEKYISKNLERK